MRLYLAPESSLQLIRYLRSVNGNEGLGGSAVRKRVLTDAINSVRGVNELDTTAQYWLGHVERPIRAFVADRARGTNTKHLITSLFSQEVPYGAFLNLGHGVCICTPAFTFLQLATSKTPAELLRIGMELCGSYSRWRMAPAVPSNTPWGGFDETQGCTFNLPPAMNAKRIDQFVQRMAGYRGAVGARAVTRFLSNNSASPMESATYLLLCLPRRLGGYGLPRPTLNPQLHVSTPEGTKERYPDLFWLGPNIDVEYNSDQDHSGEWARYRDSRREVELTVADVRVLPLTRKQLMDVDGFDAFAQGLRRMMGIRSRTPDPNWEQRHAGLRRTLLTDLG